MTGPAEPDGSVAERRPLDHGVVVLRLGSAELGLPVSVVREVLHTPPVARVPYAAPPVRGAIAVRGAVLALLDLGLRLFGRPAQRPGTTVVVVASSSAEPLGLVVDAVPGLVEPGTAELRGAPEEAHASLPPGCVAGLVVTPDGRTIALLELEHVLDGDRHAPPAGRHAETPPFQEQA